MMEKSFVDKLRNEIENTQQNHLMITRNGEGDEHEKREILNFLCSFTFQREMGENKKLEFQGGGPSTWNHIG